MMQGPPLPALHRPRAEGMRRRMTDDLMHLSDMTALRSAIDALDLELARLLARRSRMIDRAAQIKAGAGLPARIDERLQLAKPADVFPYASSTSRRLDRDHTIPYDDTGPYDTGPDHSTGPPGQTSVANLGKMTRRHHRIKTHAGWDVEQHHGRFTWTTPHGRTYVTDHHGTHRPHGDGDFETGLAALLNHRTQRVPVAVDVVEVGAAVLGAALGVDGGVQVGPADSLPGVGEAAVGLLPRQAGGADVDPRETVVAGQGRHVPGDPRIQPRLTRRDVLRMDGEPRPQLEAALGGDRP